VVACSRLNTETTESVRGSSLFGRAAGPLDVGSFICLMSKWCVVFKIRWACVTLVHKGGKPCALAGVSLRALDLVPVADGELHNGCQDVEDLQLVAAVCACVRVCVCVCGQHGLKMGKFMIGRHGPLYAKNGTTAEWLEWANVVNRVSKAGRNDSLFMRCEMTERVCG
jgi:hypothetical protein